MATHQLTSPVHQVGTYPLAGQGHRKLTVCEDPWGGLQLVDEIPDVETFEERDALVVEVGLEGLEEAEALAREYATHSIRLGEPLARNHEISWVEAG